LEQHCFGEKMAAARQEPVPGGLTADDVPQLAAPQPDPDIAVTPEPSAADLGAPRNVLILRKDSTRWDLGELGETARCEGVVAGATAVGDVGMLN
jgi:hypothetical protein